MRLNDIPATHVAEPLTDAQIASLQWAKDFMNRYEKKHEKRNN